ncbi:hypothetical protein B0H14DRAFT_2617681 [Mycena olivaceomarginata]|nr:hypothetical protein B0H14DRAFT_2617681 [Mycena olivaceomarginata]
MPPKGSGKLSEEDFRFNEDRTKVLCKVCSAGVSTERHAWIATKSGAKHMRSPEHLKAVELVQEAQRRLEKFELERRADSAASELQDLSIPHEPHIPGPAAVAQSSHARYRANGADFDAGDSTEDPGVQQRDLQSQADVFGLMNAEAVAQRLGFGNGDIAEEILAEEEELDFLGEILRSVGE